MNRHRRQHLAHLAPHAAGLSALLAPAFIHPAVRSTAGVARPATGALGVGSGTRVGFTNPSTIRDKLEKINTSATNLNESIRANIPVEGEGALFLSQWSTWLEGWDAHYEKYSGLSVSIFTNSDEVNDLTDNFSREMDGWYKDYAKQKGVDGKPVAPPLGQPPGFLNTVPTWAIALGVLGLAGASYVGYRYLKQSGSGRRRK